jgi:hypothetical protein
MPPFIERRRQDAAQGATASQHKAQRSPKPPVLDQHGVRPSAPVPTHGSTEHHGRTDETCESHTAVEHDIGRNPERLTAETAMPGDIPYTPHQQQQRSDQEEPDGE